MKYRVGEEGMKKKIYSQNDFVFLFILLIFLIVKVYLMFILFTNPSARAGYDTRSIFKRSLTGLNSEFSFS